MGAAVPEHRRVVVAGGGNGAHVAVATIAHRTGREVVWYLPYGDEATAVASALDIPPHALTVITPAGGFQVSAQNLLVTGDPSVAATADTVLLVSPAFAHRSLLQGLAPHLQPGTAVGAIPSRGGFEYEVEELVGPGVTVFGLQTLPWACRLESFGRTVRVLGTKNLTYLGCRPRTQGPALAARLTVWLGTPVVPGGGLTAMTLANTGQVLHPGLMTVHIRRWQRGAWPAVGEPPLFYQDAGEEGAELVATMSREVLAVAERLAALANGSRSESAPVDGDLGSALAGGTAFGDALDLSTVVDVFTWLRRSYEGQIGDVSSFSRALATNRAYQGIRVPVADGPPSRRPDLTSRYLTEDVPFGLAVTKGLAELAGVVTPTIDAVLGEAGDWLGTTFVDAGHLSAQGLARTRAPQRFGITTLARALAGEGETLSCREAVAKHG